LANRCLLKDTLAQLPGYEGALCGTGLEMESLF
jgi:hypothetical protein